MRSNADGGSHEYKGPWKLVVFGFEKVYKVIDDASDYAARAELSQPE